MRRSIHFHSRKAGNRNIDGVGLYKDDAYFLSLLSSDYSKLRLDFARELWFLFISFASRATEHGSGWQHGSVHTHLRIIAIVAFFSGGMDGEVTVPNISLFAFPGVLNTTTTACESECIDYSHAFFTTPVLSVIPDDLR